MRHRKDQSKGQHDRIGNGYTDPLDNSFGIFRLTDPPGLDVISNCKKTPAFHPHPDLPIYTVSRIDILYCHDTKCFARALRMVAMLEQQIMNSQFWICVIRNKVVFFKLRAFWTLLK